MVSQTVRLEFANDAGLLSKSSYSRVVARPTLTFKNARPSMLPERLVAMIDTGAGRSYVQIDKVNKLPPSEENIPSQGAHGEPVFLSAYEAVLTFDGCSVPMRTNLIGTDLRTRKFNVDMIIGVDLLQFGRLIVDYAGKVASFEFV